LGLSRLTSRLRAAGCVYAEEEAALLIDAASSDGELEAMVVRRLAGTPIEQVLGWAEFCGLRILLDPGVFVPRRRTELLVRAALAMGGTVVVDLCCGSGAIAAAFANQAPLAEVYACDVDHAAVRCARRNLPGGNVFEGDLFEALPPDLRGRVDLLLVNAPYVPTAAISLMAAEARDHEPLNALDGGEDGLAVQHRVIADAPQWLAPGGHLLIETSDVQCAATLAAMGAVGLSAQVASDDELGATIAIGRRS